MARPKRDPKTKEDILNRMLSYDFDGDIRRLGEEPAQITRTGPHTLRLTFPASGRVFDVSVHRPREFAQPRQPAPAPTQRENRTFRQEVPDVVEEQAHARAEEQPRKRTRRKSIDRSVPPSERRRMERQESRG